MKRALIGVIGIVLISSFFIGAASVFTKDTETGKFVSVEIGLAELSPAGESGGYAVPASADSSGCPCGGTPYWGGKDGDILMWSCNSCPVPPPPPQCSNGGDDDGDGTIDYPADLGCSDANDDDELNPTQCSDTFDNDNDGPSDLADPSCSGVGDNDEAFPAQCADGVDNDGDVSVDFVAGWPAGSDLGCSSITDNEEIDPPVIISIIASPILVRSGGSSTINWNAEFVTSCTVTGPSGVLASNPTIEPYTTFNSSYNATDITEEVIFTLACDGFDGNESSTSVRVNVLPTFEEF